MTPDIKAQTDKVNPGDASSKEPGELTLEHDGAAPLLLHHICAFRHVNSSSLLCVGTMGINSEKEIPG